MVLCCEEKLVHYLGSLPLATRILVIASIPAVMTALGTLPVLLGRRVGEKFLDAGLGFSAGVMLVASFTSLLLPAIDSGRLVSVYTGFVAGVLMILLLDKTIPHLHVMKGYEGPRGSGRALKKVVLLVLAIMIHNIPEGMAVGVSTIYSIVDGLVIAIAIGLQDIPEGLAVALPLYMVTRSPGKSIGIGVLSGLTELLAAYIPLGILVVFNASTTTLLPFLMSLSAGAMIYVVVHEIIPEIYGHEHDEPSTIGFFIGFLAMLLLDTLLG